MKHFLAGNAVETFKLSRIFKTTPYSIAVGLKKSQKMRGTYASTINWTIWSNEACCSELKSCMSNSLRRRYPPAVVNYLAWPITTVPCKFLASANLPKYKF